MTQQTPPRTILVNSERDLGNLVKGDLVKVALLKTPQWMVYGGIRNGRDSFIEGPHERVIHVWQSERRYLQFPGDNIRLDSLHRNYVAIEPASPDYEEIKSLADTLKA